MRSLFILLTTFLLSCQSAGAVTIISGGSSQNLGGGLINSENTLFSRTFGSHVETGSLFPYDMPQDEAYYTKRIEEMPDTPQHHYDYAGFLSQQDGRASEYEAQLQRVRELDPSHRRAAEALSLFYLRRGELEKAVTLGNDKVVITPERYIALADILYWQAGVIYFKTLYEKAYQTDPKNLRAIARYLNEHKHKEDMMKPLFMEAIDAGLLPGNQFYKNSITYMRRFGGLRDTLAILREKFPGDYYTALASANHLLKVGEVEKARAEFQIAHELLDHFFANRKTRNNRKPRINTMAEMLRELSFGDLFVWEALDLMEKGEELPNIETVGGLLNTAAASEEKEKVYKAYLEQYPDNPQLLADYAFHLDGLDKKEKAEEYYAKALSTDFEIFEEYHNYRWPKHNLYQDPAEEHTHDDIHKRLKQVSEENQQFKEFQFLAKLDRYYRTFVHRELTYVSYERGLELIFEALEKAKNKRMVERALVAFYIAQEREDEGHKYFYQGIEQNPDDVAGYKKYGFFLSTAAHMSDNVSHADALNYYLSTWEKFPGDKDIGQNMMDVLEEIDDFYRMDVKKIQKIVAEAVEGETDESYWEQYLSFMKQHAPRADYEAALIKAYQVEDKEGKLQSDYHEFLAAMGRSDDLIRLAEDFIVIEDEDRENAMIDLSWSLLDFEDDQRIEGLLKRITEIVDGYGYARAHYGYYLFQKGQEEAAKAIFKDAVKRSRRLTDWYEGEKRWDTAKEAKRRAAIYSHLIDAENALRQEAVEGE